MVAEPRAGRAAGRLAGADRCGARRVALVLTDDPDAGRHRLRDGPRPGETGPGPTGGATERVVVQGPRCAPGTPAGLAPLPVDLDLPDTWDPEDTLVLVLPGWARPAAGLVDRVADAARAADARLVTWDHDVVVDGRCTPALRFGWSPEVLLSADYTGGAFALALPDYRRAVARLRDLGVDLEVDLTAWSLLLALPVDLAPTVHLPQTLTELARPVPAPVPDTRAEGILDAALALREVPARARRSGGVTRLEWHPAAWPSVTVVVPTRHHRANLEVLFASLAMTTGPAYELVVVDNGGRTPDREAWYERHGPPGLTVHWWDEEPFNYSRVNNVAVARSAGEVVVLLNDDTEVLDPGWLAELVGLACLPGVGVVGMQLLTGADTVQHAGVWLGLGGYAGHLLAGLPPDADTLLGPVSWYRNTLAVTAACLAVRREHYLEVGGLDERMTLCGSDVTLGLDQVAAGRRNICSPLGALRHFESVTRSSPPLRDQVVSLVRYQPWHDAGDPFGNPRLSRRSRVPALAVTGETDPVAEARAVHGLVM